jgi:ABC-type transport system involved in multi-copper enzyme maturation permease subunit
VLAGPLLTRELLTTPRKWQHFLLRAGYVGVLAILMYTAGQATFGFQKIRGVGDVARFGGYVFGLLAVVQLSLVIAASLLFSANTVAQEKDRRTLVLLLMTDLSSLELVLGKLLGSLLPVWTLILVSLPVFLILRLLGGIELAQVLWLALLCCATALLAGAWGTFVAYWRDKTFQTLAVTTIGAGLFLGLVEAALVIAGDDSAAGRWLSMLNPYRGLNALLDPFANQPNVAIPTISAAGPCLMLLMASLGLTAWTTWRVRIWNPSRAAYEQVREQVTAEGTTRVRQRLIWSNPVLWREICTRAYGRRMAVIKVAYLLLAGLLALWIIREPPASPLVMGMLTRSGAAFAMLVVVGLLLVTAQAVTSLTSERDGQTLELLLVTDLTAREFIFGKLGGIFYNSKEVLVVPLLFLVAFAARGGLSVENFVYLLLGLGTLGTFCATLGVHTALTYTVSRQAIVHSLATVFFLFVGTFICMVMIVEARASFQLQLPSFAVFILGGTIGLWASLGARNPSPALVLAAFLLPFCTFYSVIGYLLGNTLGVATVILVSYGFAAIAMLVPAVSEFDYALGRTTLDRG